MTINIRDIQHYMYCPRRFALINTDNSWHENAYVVMANIMHNRVHSGKHKIVSNSKYELSDVYIYNDDLDILGKADCIEFDKSEKGVYIDRLNDKFNVKIIEYKPTKPKNADYNETDAIQVFAQKLCVDYIWKCNSEAYIYYADVRKRIKLPFDNNNDIYLRNIKRYIKDMSDIAQNNIIPKRSKGQKCSGCSMKDVCMPNTKNINMYNLIKETLETE